MVDTAVERLILVIDQDPDHVRIIETTLNQSQRSYRLVAIANGSEALDFLHHRGVHDTSPRPDLILLDLNLSNCDGLEMLAEIKANDQLRRIPIIVFTRLARIDHILRSYALQGNCYVIKSDNPHNLSEIVKRIEEFWLGIVTLPVE